VEINVFTGDDDDIVCATVPELQTWMKKYMDKCFERFQTEFGDLKGTVKEMEVNCIQNCNGLRIIYKISFMVYFKDFG
jgi:hypothetical protein